MKQIPIIYHITPNRDIYFIHWIRNWSPDIETSNSNSYSLYVLLRPKCSQDRFFI